MSTKKIQAFRTAQILFCLLVQINTQLDEWKIPCGATYKPENCENASVTTLEFVEDFERCAPARLDPFSRDYVWGASGNQKTLRENKEAYSRMWLKKRVLCGNSNYSLETEVFGRRIAFPLGVSPTVGHSIYHPEGEIGTAKGAASVGAIMILNGYSLTLLEDVAAAVPQNTELWIQTYIHTKRELTAQLVQRAEKAGFKAVVVTIDEPFQTDVKCNSRIRFFYRYINMKCPNLPNQTHTNDTAIDPTLTFKDISWLSEQTKLPIVAKGILTAEDAIEAIDAGASAIYVSNQGGRELDGSLPTIDALPAIVRAVKSRYPNVDVFIDGGIRTGRDVFKALARGAKIVFVGRPAIWGLAIGGESGVNAVLSIIKNEFKETMIHAGFSSPQHIKSSSVISNWIYSDFK